MGDNRLTKNSTIQSNIQILEIAIKENEVDKIHRIPRYTYLVTRISSNIFE